MNRRDVMARALVGTAAATAATMAPLNTAEAQSCTPPCYPRTAAEAAAGVTPQNTSYPPGNVLRYLPTSGNGSQAAQQCLAANPYCYLPAGTYSFPTAVTVGDAQVVYGDSRGVSIINSPAGASTFVWHPAGAADREGPSFHDLQINSDNPITINSLTTTVLDGSGDSPCKNSSFEDLILTSITPSSGYGICVSKMFDSTIARCRITGYSIGILLHGSDINHVYDNRLVEFATFGILDQSAQTFGSQNEIRHNDILSPAGSTAIFIKSTSIHARIYDNYMEAPGDPCTGFVDLTTGGIPAIFGSNVVSQPYFSVIIKDNRADGENLASFVYQIDPNDSVTIVCENVNTTGTNGTSRFTSDVLARYSSFHGKTIRIAGQSWGLWDGYHSRQSYNSEGGCISCTGANLPAIINKDNNASVVIRGSTLVLPVSFSSLAWVVPNAAWVENRLFRAGTTYTGRVIARSTASSGDTLNIAVGSSSFGDSLNPFALTDQFAEYSWTFSGQPRTGNDLMGFYLTRTGSAGDIEIAVISFT